MNKQNQLSGSEAVYGFAAWLTTKNEPVVISAHKDAAYVCDLVSQFCEINNLDEPRSNWTNNLTHPPTMNEIVIKEVEPLDTTH